MRYLVDLSVTQIVTETWEVEYPEGWGRIEVENEVRADPYSVFERTHQLVDSDLYDITKTEFLQIASDPRQ